MHHHQVGKIGSSGNSGNVLFHDQHHLHISSLHPGGGGNGGTNTSSSGSSSGSISSSFNSLTAATNSLYHHDSGSVSPTDTNSAAVAFVDSPFFSSLASVAAATSGASQTVTGSLGSGSGLMSIAKKKSNDRKLTINLNHKTTNFLTAASGTLSTQNANQQFRTNNTNIRNNAHPNQLTTIGQHMAAAAAAAAFHNLNNNSLTAKSAAETVLSQRALVDYSDEDSDEDDGSENSDTQKEEENVGDADEDDNDYDAKIMNDVKVEHSSSHHHHHHHHHQRPSNKPTEVSSGDGGSITKINKKHKSCSKHHGSSGSLKLDKSNSAVNNDSDCSATVVNETTSISKLKTNGSDEKSKSTDDNINDERVSNSLPEEQPIDDNSATSDDNSEKENLINRKRKSSDDSNDDDDDEQEQDVDDDHLETSKIEQLFNNVVENTESSTDSSSCTDTSSKRFRYSFVESDETHTTES
ncbi:hypothetical protein BLA29_000604 [Euroglyphus maynei]|uniref:Uncharacterized protein n=1 Tax=Euroglyphus maynei TaxID=6958 RepID=A0A1Y3BLV4_EURMA|nr:hypothetical protein BLA29_000604 [Euroglyphus maynei]